VDQCVAPGTPDLPGTPEAPVPDLGDVRCSTDPDATQAEACACLCERILCAQGNQCGLNDGTCGCFQSGDTSPRPILFRDPADGFLARFIARGDFSLLP
jgi:hypothetical protein